jgi:hypothetical protein
MDMSKLASFIGMTVGGAIGWYAGMVVGYMTAFILSCVGSGVGLYVTRRALQQYLVLILGLSLVTASNSGAQAPAPTPTPGAVKAATELMQVMHADKTLHDQISAAFDVQIQNNPAMVPYRGAMQQFADKYLTWDAIGPQLTTAYAEVFTESELKDLIAFYKTPTGQKLSSQQATLSAKGQAIGLAVVQAHQGELADLIRRQQAGATQPADTTKH